MNLPGAGLAGVAAAARRRRKVAQKAEG